MGARGKKKRDAKEGHYINKKEEKNGHDIIRLSLNETDPYLLLHFGLSCLQDPEAHRNLFILLFDDIDKLTP